MKKIIELVLLSLIIFFVSFSSSIISVAICGTRGEYLYQKHCSGCHRDAAKLKRVKDITSSMRNPPAAMPQFGIDKVSDIDAEEIANYIHLGPVVRSVAKTNDTGNSRSVAQR